ncbi:MAG TPA: DsbA family oxidoreductase [Candidatus Binataceae bacterium]
MALKIAMFSDFVCPFCYIGFEVIRKLKPEFSFDLEWRGFQIHPEWPAEGIPAEKMIGNAEARRAAWNRIAAMADAIELKMKPPERLTNSRSALLVAEYAKDAGKGEAFEQKVYRAYFEQDVNIGDRDELIRLASEVGLDAPGTGGALDSQKYELRLKNNALAAHQRGVDGVPTFFIGEYPLVGAQSIETMRQILTRATERMEAAK